MNELCLCTIGHSNQPIETFIALLRQHDVKVLIDVRSHPGSTHNPQYNQEALRTSLELAGILYHWAGRELGGKRPSNPQSIHVQLAEVRRPFADYMQSGEFERAAMQLVNLARKSPAAIMCAEADPMNCHRSLIADYLVLQGVKVLHILKDALLEHQLSPYARRESLQLIYDRHVTAELDLR